VVCYCRHIHILPTRTRVLLLQHPKERRVGIGTARMAHLSLPNSSLRVGLDFSADEVVRAALAGEGRVCVLFPRPGAMDVSELPSGEAITLVVLDGTWSLARKLLRLNPELAALPHVAFTPRRPSDYRIRRQPSESCVSTIEALAEVLGVLEPDKGSFDGLLEPFRAMVERQEYFATEVASHRHRRALRAPRVSRRAALATRLSANWSRLVCVQGDTNAWPRRDPARQVPEIVHWTSHRLATGETYEAVLAPRRPLAPTTSAQIELPVSRLRAGHSAEVWRRSWSEFLRPDDMTVTWGTFYNDLAADDGLALPTGGVDLRVEALRLLHAPTPHAGESATRSRLRTVDACAELLGVEAVPLGLAGRAGRRLGALVGLVGALARGGGATS
jgi:DTW domain-containing protein YfiP